jgi:hypothetical protein
MQIERAAFSAQGLRALNSPPRCGFACGGPSPWPALQKRRLCLPLAKMRSAECIRHVRVQGQSGKHLLALSSSEFDPTETWRASCLWRPFPASYYWWGGSTAGPLIQDAGWIGGQYAMGRAYSLDLRERVVAAVAAPG